MRAHFVADASIAIAWIHPAQATKETESLLDEIAEGARFTVPALWFFEVANALLVLERRRKIRPDERVAALGTLHALAPIVDEEGHRLAFGEISELAARHHLSVHDATYAELALREKLPLATKDDSLRAVVSKARTRAPVKPTKLKP